MRTTAVIVLLFASVHLLRADGLQLYGCYNYHSTNKYAFEVSWTVVDKTPIWRESDDQPPLPARKALRIARTGLARVITDGEHWRLDQVSLSPLPEHDGRWIYLVRFCPPPPPNRPFNGFVKPMTIPVLMSGVAVQPKVSL